MKPLPVLCVLLAALSAGAQTKQWWMDEPVRLILPLINENQSALDTDRFIQQLVDMNANTVLLPTGGIAAHYPTKVEFHYRSPSLPPGRDLLGEVVKKAHERGIRVMSRFEWTMVQSNGAFEAHPDWFQRQADGKPNIWNGCYFTCINGGYYQEQAFKILAEVLEQYPIDGTFFNASGQRMWDNNGRTYPPCHCDNCKRLFRAKYNRDIPAAADAQYTEFMNEANRAILSKMAQFIRSKRPGINVMLGRGNAAYVDSFNSEVHSASVISAGPIADHPYWLYAASEIVNGARTTYPNQMAFDNDAAFLDNFWRYAHRSAPDGEIRAFQNMAHGAGPYLFINGSLDQNDGNALKGARAPFKFHKDHEDLYVRQENAARILLLEGRPATRGLIGGTAGSTRGFIRILSEQHIPYALSNDLSWIDKDPGRYDLVISAQGAPAALDKYLRQGGRVLVAGAAKPELELPPVVKLWKKTETESAYWRVRDRTLLPSLKDTDIVFFYSDYLELEPRGNSPLTLIPTSMIGPMEKVHADWKDTTKPGLYIADYGKGKLAYIPWDIGDLYYRFSPVYHSAIVGDLVDALLPKGRQLRTNAHPMVEMTLQQQKQRRRTLVHFINLSGCSQTAYHPAIPMSNISVEVTGQFESARMASTGRDLALKREGGWVSFTLPSLDTYDVVVLR